MNVHRRLDDPGDELGPEAGLEERLVLVVEASRSPRAGGRTAFTIGVPGVHLLDVAVERAGPLPLGGELLLGALGDERS